MVQARKPGTVMYNVIAPAITLSRINLCIDGHFHFFIPSPARRLQPGGLDGRYLDRRLLRGRRMGECRLFISGLATGQVLVLVCTGTFKSAGCGKAGNFAFVVSWRNESSDTRETLVPNRTESCRGGARFT